MNLSTSDVHVGGEFVGGPTISDEPLHRLLQVGNMGGFRAKKSVNRGIAYVVLFSTGVEKEWPDGYEPSDGTFRYFGDNRTVGKDLLSSDGNKLLARINELDLDTLTGRLACPPFLLFNSVPKGPPRTVRSVGLAVPAVGQWCVAKYFGTARKFLNFEITLNVLADQVISRGWIDELVEGKVNGPSCPDWYRHWLVTGQAVVVKSRVLPKEDTK
jgi:hypothetical protein